MSIEVALRLQLARLEQENEELRAKLSALETMYETKYSPSPEWGLTRGEGRVFSVLLANRIATNEQLLAALVDLAHWDDLPSSLNSVRVLLYNLRHKLEPFGIEIVNVWGVGYSMKGVPR